MSFVSFEFAILYVLTVPLFYLLPHRYRWLLILIASYAFYMSWRWNYIFLIVLTTTFDYFVARGIHASKEAWRRKALLGLSITLNFGLLFTYKYLDFLSSSLTHLLGALGHPHQIPALHLLLPIGISFYTFQEVAYVIDVYRGVLPPERRFGIFASFISFFPQLVAGPISRAKQLLPQFHNEIRFNAAQVVEGFQLMLWGAFKKVVIADRLAAYVNEVYGHPKDFSGFTVLLATFFFAFQIYCDFSGYSDIAVGVARTMGFNLMSNFRQPYFARSIKDFWQRWHISLSTWFKDYLYFPLGGSRVGPVRWRFNLAMVFLVSGLWHGAAWTFVIWGGLHAVYMVAETMIMPALPKQATGPLARAMGFGGILLTFSMVCLAWIFFRAGSLTDAWHIVTGITQLTPNRTEIAMAFGTKQELAVSLGLIGILLGVDWQLETQNLGSLFGRLSPKLRWAFYYGGMAAILLMGRWGSQEFIYFQF
ncbi:MAG: algI [Fibrobacteres bacterium]|nr:algI [Fibrobacterota bacterium]